MPRSLIVLLCFGVYLLNAGHSHAPQLVGYHAVLLSVPMMLHWLCSDDCN